MALDRYEVLPAVIAVVIVVAVVGYFGFSYFYALNKADNYARACMELAADNGLPREIYKVLEIDTSSFLEAEAAGEAVIVNKLLRKSSIYQEVLEAVSKSYPSAELLDDKTLVKRYCSLIAVERLEEELCGKPVTKTLLEDMHSRALQEAKGMVGKVLARLVELGGSRQPLGEYLACLLNLTQWVSSLEVELSCYRKWLLIDMLKEVLSLYRVQEELKVVDKLIDYVEEHYKPLPSDPVKELVEGLDGEIQRELSHLLATPYNAVKILAKSLADDYNYTKLKKSMKVEGYALLKLLDYWAEVKALKVFEGEFEDLKVDKMADVKREALEAIEEGLAKIKMLQKQQIDVCVLRKVLLSSLQEVELGDSAVKAFISFKYELMLYEAYTHYLKAYFLATAGFEKLYTLLSSTGGEGG